MMAIPEDELGDGAVQGPDVPAAVRAADHAMGLELQIEELQEQRARAEVQGRSDDAARLGEEMAALQTELARTAEDVAGSPDPAVDAPGPPVADLSGATPPFPDPR